MKKHRQWPRPRECTVTHPDYKDPVIVKAQDEPEAIYKAALYWGRDWTRYNFYAYCTVISVKPRH